jgi:hypothetical protein
LAVLLSTLLIGTAVSAPVRLVIDVDPAAPVRHAIDELEDALRGQGIAAIRNNQMDPAARVNFVVGQVGASPLVDELVKRNGLSVPESAESLLIKRISHAGTSSIILAGRDRRGLMYAVLEAAEAVRLAPQSIDPLLIVADAAESPQLRFRSVTTQLFNADLERSWYYNETYWRGYFAMLARNRFNNFTLTFGHQTNYLTPPYPWLFKTPEYPDVHVEGVSETDRANNLNMLRRIAEIAAEHDIDFTVGIWTQRPVQESEMNYGATLVRNFPPGQQGSDYCAKGLGRLLKECPAIRGVQLRMNDESGVPDSQQEAYYQSQFDAIKNCGHPVRLELRYKELRQQTIDQAVRTGLDLTVSTKFWCEHMGLPYHPTIQDQKYSQSRYGYGSMLFHPRNYRVVYQLWTVGTNRVLLWGDPFYAARFAECCQLGGGEGFEVFAPLSYRGYGNEPGNWRLFADQSLNDREWEYQRYWMYFLTFGRLGYNPATPADIWQREMQSRFGSAAVDIETAYRKASQVLPLITTTCQFSAGGWGFWPEMSTCLPLESYALIQPSDYGQFYAISAWRQVGSWKSEPWSSDHRGFVEDAVAGELEGKWTPIQISHKLSQLADGILAAVQAARSVSTNPESAEFRSTELDFRVLAQLARYHAAKKLAATQIEFFRAADQPGRLPRALAHAREATTAWEELVRLTEGTYHDNLVFGFSEQMAAQYGHKLHVHTGHWKDRLPEVHADERYVADLIAEHGTADGSYQPFPGETPPVARPRIQHVPVRLAQPGVDVAVVARVESAKPLRAVLLHYRPMDQTQTWKQISMEPDGQGNHRGVILGRDIQDRYDMLYFLEARIEGGGTLWPNWEEQTPYIVLSVDRTAP